MPTYDYRCADCGGFDALRSVAQRDLPLPCPDCGAAAERVMSSAPRLALMADGTRRAIATNERAGARAEALGRLPAPEASLGLRLLQRRPKKCHRDRARRRQVVPVQATLDDQPLGAAP